MLGNRPSALPISQFCGRAAALDAGAGRAAAVSSCFHAKCAGDEKWREMHARLSDEEQEELDAMIYPTDVTVGGQLLRYEDAHKEVKVGLSIHCGFDTGPHALTVGTCDMYWIRGRVAYVADIKRSQWTASEGPDSLQVKCYALAVCAMANSCGDHSLEVDGYVTGIWAATEGVWEWGEYVSLYGEQCLKDWERVKAAALNKTDEYSTGPHCRGCYSRLKCPAWLVDHKSASTELAKYLSGDIDNDRAYEARLFLDRVKDTAKSMEEVLKVYATTYGGISGPDGKVWRAVSCNGRMSFDAKALEEEHPELAQKYMRPGKSFDRFKWCKGSKK